MLKTFSRSGPRLYLALMAASILVPALTFAAASWQNYLDLRREAEEKVVRTVAILDEQADKVFQTQELALALVDEHVRGMSWDEISTPATSEFIRQLKAPLEQAASIWVTDRNGRVRAGSQSFSSIDTNHSDRDFFVAQRDRDAGVYISAPFLGRATGIASFALSRRRSTPDGRFDGIIHSALSPGYFERFFKEAVPFPGHSALLARADGSILARDPPAASGKLPPDAALMQAIADQPTSGAYTRISSVDGRKRSYAYRKVGAYPVYVGFGIGSDVIMEDWSRNLVIYGAVAAIASLTLLLISGLAQRRASAEQAALVQLRREVAQRESAEDALRQAQKMEAVGQLTGGVAHDFNNLLTAIIGNLELIVVSAGLPDRVRKLAGAAIQASERGATLTQQLLAFSRRQVLRPDVVDLNRLIEEFLPLLQHAVGEAVRIETDFAANLSPCSIDPGQFQAALLNLVVNARDAKPRGGTIAIRTSHATIAATDSARLDRAPGSYVAVAVSDEGHGMSPEVAARAFEPFFTTKEVGKGSGLGLSMVYGFATQSGGHVELRSEVDVGTTVEIYIPCSAAQGEAVAAAASAAPAVQAGHGTVLVVEDNDDVSSAVGGMLTELGYRVLSASDGHSAMALLRGPVQIDLLFSDLVMPNGMSGVELAEQARQLRKGIKVLLTSGYAPGRQFPGGDLPILRKPYRKAELAAAIQVNMA